MTKTVKWALAGGAVAVGLYLFAKSRKSIASVPYGVDAISGGGVVGNVGGNIGGTASGVGTKAPDPRDADTWYPYSPYTTWKDRLEAAYLAEDDAVPPMLRR